jgi:hypothetical protein
MPIPYIDNSPIIVIKQELSETAGKNIFFVQTQGKIKIKNLKIFK